MSKTIDLSMFQNETIDYKFSEDLIIKCKKPDEELAIKILAHAEIKEEDITATEMIAALNDLTKDILNHNIDNKIIEDNFVKALPFDLKIYILQSYTQEMYTKTEQNPN